MISQASFHLWRTKLANGTDKRAAAPTPASTLIDLGTVRSAMVSAAPAQSTPTQAPLTMPGIDIRIDLGGGVVLTIVRR